jgi:uncharacterized GH25 family protein
VLLAMALATAARAHDFWIEPGHFIIDGPAPVTVTLLVGEHFKGESVPYIDDWIDRFEVVDGAGRRTVAGQIGDDPAGRVGLRAPGAGWVTYQSNDDFVELPPDKFREYLEQEGMEYVLPLRTSRGLEARPAREYYVRCAKALLWHPGGRGVDVAAPLGLTLEIVPETSPYELAPGAPFEVRLLHRGAPVTGLLVKAFTRETPKAEQLVRTDADGRARLRLDRAGTWIVKSVHMVPVEGDPHGEWRSYWASLTFAVVD